MIEDAHCPTNSSAWAAAGDELSDEAVEPYLLSLGADQLGWAERVYKDGAWVHPADA